MKQAAVTVTATVRHSDARFQRLAGLAHVEEESAEPGDNARGGDGGLEHLRVVRQHLRVVEHALHHLHGVTAGRPLRHGVPTGYIHTHAHTHTHTHIHTHTYTHTRKHTHAHATMQGKVFMLKTSLHR